MRESRGDVARLAQFGSLGSQALLRPTEGLLGGLAAPEP